MVLRTKGDHAGISALAEHCNYPWSLKNPWAVPWCGSDVVHLKAAWALGVSKESGVIQACSQGWKSLPQAPRRQLISDHCVLFGPHTCCCSEADPLPCLVPTSERSSFTHPRLQWCLFWGAHLGSWTLAFAKPWSQSTQAVEVRKISRRSCGK